jgi:hypothetical protein
MIERVSRLSGEAFRHDYLDTKTPVIITDMMADWPAMTLWNQDYLTKVCGDQMVEVMANRDSDPLFEIHAESHRTSMRFAELAALAFSPIVSNNIYMVSNNKFIATAGGQHLMNDVRSLPYLTEHPDPDQVFFWFGPAGTVTPLHYGYVSIIFTQVHGSKHFRLYSPDQTRWLYNSFGIYSSVDVEKPDLERYPLFRNAEAEELDIMAGEVLFLPKGHWHQVRSLTPSISVSFANLSHENVNHVGRHNARRQARRHIARRDRLHPTI